MTEETLAALGEAKAFAKYADRDALIDAVKSLAGSVWRTRAEAKMALVGAAAANGVQWPGPSVEKAVWNAVAVSDPEGELQAKKGEPLPDPELRDYENVPLGEGIDEYMEREVLPHVPDAWIAEHKDVRTGETSRARIGYEIPFTRYFYRYTPPRPLVEIDAELKDLESQIQTLLRQVTE